MRNDENWGTDTPISEPVPSRFEVKVDFEGFGFTMGGVTFAVSEEELDDMLRPMFRPEGYQEDDDFPPIVPGGDD